MAKEPKDPSDRMREARLQPHAELFLSGDYSSPQEVLADGNLKDGQKREILEFWRQDLSGKDHIPEVRVLLASIDSSLQKLPPR